MLYSFQELAQNPTRRIKEFRYCIYISLAVLSTMRQEDYGLIEMFTIVKRNFRVADYSNAHIMMKRANVSTNDHLFKVGDLWTN